MDNLLAVKTGSVNFFIYKSDEDFICFDSGFGKSLIIRQLNSLGMDPGKITHVFLTHSDFDHASGSALFDRARIYLSADEEPMITGKKARMLGFIYNSKIKRLYHLLHDNEVVTISSTNILAIATPGHTAGSMSYLVNGSILIVGDTFKLIDGKVCSLRGYINMDTERQKVSIRKLACLDHVELACTAHTGYTREFNEAMRDWK
jgi:hydroxyacylglutathione hydrolase